MNDNVDIFIYSHIPFTPAVTNKTYKILTHSDKEMDGNLEVLRDYEGDNIGDKNLMYNEYTGFYWLWKNYKLKDYIGLNHYRRYYSWMDNIPDIETMFKYCKCVLNKPIDLICPLNKQVMNNREWYGWWHNIEDFDNLKLLFEEEYPQYMDGFNKMEKANICYNSSMFILKKEDFIKYCEFIFPLLKKYTERFNLNTTEECIHHVKDNLDKYEKTAQRCGYNLPYYDLTMQSRIIGYVAERAMNAYFMNGEDSLENGAAIIEWVQINKK